MGANDSGGQQGVSGGKPTLHYDITRSHQDRSAVAERPAQSRHELPATIPVGAYHAYFHRNHHGTDERPLRRVDGRDLDWLSTDQWLGYDIDVQDPGSYRVELRVAGDDAFGGGDVGVVLDDDPLSRLTFGPTGGWYDWDRIESEVELPAGNHTLRLVVFDGGWKLDEITVA